MISLVNWLPSRPRRMLGRVKQNAGRVLDGAFGPKPSEHGSWYIDANQRLPDILNMPLLAWINYHQREVHSKQCYWMGQRALKNPMDAWIYQEIIFEIKPDIIIEIGNKNGGSTQFLAGMCELLGQGRVLALDIDHSVFTASHPRIEMITGDCSDQDILAMVREKCQGQKVLIIHDADHTKAAVLRDLRNFAPLVSPGSYLIVEDTTIGIPGFSGDPNNPVGPYLMPRQNTPLQAIEEFLRENPNFVVDESRERYILTHNYRGYLRRMD